MKRLVIASALALALVLTPNAAFGGNAVRHKLTGSITPSGHISIVAQRKTSGKMFVKNPIWATVPITCDSGSETTSGDATGTVFNVKSDRTFTASLANGGTAFAVIRGTLNRRLTKASGTIRVHGSKVPIDPSGSGTHCDTGVLNWSAHK